MNNLNAQSPQRVLLLSNSLGIGGAERLVASLADQLAARGHQVMVVSLVGPTLFKPDNPQVEVVALQMSKTPAGFVRGYLGVRRLIRRFRPDVVHSHMVHANLLARLLRLSISIPRLICTAHNTNEGGRLRMLAYRLTDGLADLSTNVSLEAVAAFEQKGAVPKGRMLAVMNGIDCAEFYADAASRAQTRRLLASTESEQVFIAVGRLTEAKDFPNLLRAFVSVSEACPHACLWIVGDGPLRNELEAQAMSLGLGGRVRFLGIRRDVPLLLRAADIFVLSSAWEGFCLAAAEAMATQLPVVVTDCGGVRETVGDCGFMVPAGDSAALAVAMLQAARLSPGQAQLIGERARQRVLELYSLERMVDRWQTLYTGANR